MRISIALGIVLAVLAGSPAFATAPAALAPLAFLLGEWPASGGGQPGVASGTTVFARGLQDQVILRTSFAEYAATGGKPGSRHDDFMIIYASPGAGARADYYDSEGHVIRYVITSPAAGQALFLSEATAGEPRFRLNYQLDATGLLKGDFAIAPPAAPEAFKQYLSWESRQAPAAPAK